MKKSIIEREMAGVGNSSDQDLGQAAGKSNQVLAELGNGIQWLESFVAGWPPLWSPSTSTTTSRSTAMQATPSSTTPRSDRSSPGR